MDNTGRPTIFTLELAVAICDRLIAGEPMRLICQDVKAPSETTVYRWLHSNEHAGFRELYARAREAQAHRMLDEIIQIADDASRDVVEIIIYRDEDTGREDTRDVERFTAPARDKLKIDTRKWAMAKLAPKVYGDSKALDVTSAGERITGFAIVDYTDDDSSV